MFAICLSFLIFASANFNLIGGMIKTKLEETLGADLYGVTIDFQGMTSLLDEGQISNFLNQQQLEHGDVKSWTFVSQDLQYLLKYLTEEKYTTIMSGYAGFKELTSQIYSVQENFLEAVDLNYLIPQEV